MVAQCSNPDCNCLFRELSKGTTVLAPSDAPLFCDVECWEALRSLLLALPRVRRDSYDNARRVGNRCQPTSIGPSESRTRRPSSRCRKCADQLYGKKQPDLYYS
jgi:hypothetical protein